MKNVWNYLTPLVILLTLFGITGCSKEKIAEVSGTITCQGEPVPDFLVRMTPIHDDGTLGQPSVGLTDAAGHYTLINRNTKENGAIVGKCRVMIEWKDPEPSQEYPPEIHYPPIPLPKNASDGTLTFDVPPEGTNAANFDF